MTLELFLVIRFGLFLGKRGCVFPMVIWPAFRIGQYRVHDHPYHAPQFTDCICMKKFVEIKFKFFGNWNSIDFDFESKIKTYEVLNEESLENETRISDIEIEVSLKQCIKGFTLLFVRVHLW